MELKWKGAQRSAYTFAFTSALSLSIACRLCRSFARFHAYGHYKLIAATDRSAQHTTRFHNYFGGAWHRSGPDTIPILISYIFCHGCVMLITKLLNFTRMTALLFMSSSSSTHSHTGSHNRKLHRNDYNNVHMKTTTQPYQRTLYVPAAYKCANERRGGCFNLVCLNCPCCVCVYAARMILCYGFWEPIMMSLQ